MDFWDLTKLLFRRWRVSLPLFVLAIGISAAAAVMLKPSYSATSHVQLLPAAAVQPTDVTTSGPHNPWSDLGVDALGQAALTAVLDQDVLTTLVADGYTDNITIGMNGPTPIVTITAVAKTPQLASSSALEVVQLLDQHVSALQSPYGIKSNEFITTRVLDSGPQVQKVNSKVIRAVLVIAATGLVLTAGLTLLADAVLRRRALRRAAPDGGRQPSVQATATVGGQPRTRRLWSVVSGAREAPDAIEARAAETRPEHNGAPAMTPGSDSDRRATERGANYSLTMTRLTMNEPPAAANVRDPRDQRDERAEPARRSPSSDDTISFATASSDETIVLPALTSVSRRKDGSDQR